MYIGEKIRSLRLSKNITQQAIAKKICISVTAFGDIERGKTKDFTVSRLEQIAKALEVSAKELLDDGNNNQTASNIELIKLQEKLIEGYKMALSLKDKETEQCKHLLNKANKELKKRQRK